MKDPFETVGTYFDQTEAQAALLAIQREGILGTLEGAEIAAMDWLMVNAIGGIRLKVPADQADYAREILESHRPKGAIANQDWELAEESTEENDDDVRGEFGNEDDERAGEPNAREKMASRALNMAVFGYVIWPFHVYAWFLLVRVFTSDEPLARRFRRRGWFAFWLTLPIFVISLVLLREVAVGRL